MKSYTYKLTHRITKHFYFGYRSANKVSASDDLGVKYFSSNAKIAKTFSEYDYEVLQEFDFADDAWYAEQALIEENWKNPLLLNRHFQRNRSSFSMKGAKRPDLSEINIRTKTKPREIRYYTCTYCETQYERIEIQHHPVKQKPFCSRKCSASFTCTQNAKRAKGQSNFKLIGKPSWNKGKSNPQAAENGKKSAQKLSATVKGRKKVEVDGRRTWAYQDHLGWYTKKNGTKCYLGPASAVWLQGS